MAKKRTLKDYTALGSLSAEMILKNLPFVLFLGFIGMIYIANAHYSERKIEQMNQYEKEIRDLQWEYMAIKSDLMYQSKQSEVAKVVKKYGLQNTTSTPKKIIIKKRVVKTEK